MSKSFYYYLDNNVFSGLHNKFHYDIFFKDLSAFEKVQNINEKDRKYISTPFAIIEYLGIEVASRPKPNSTEIKTLVTCYSPEDFFLEFCKYTKGFFFNEVENYYKLILEKNRIKIEPQSEEEKEHAIKPHLKELWNDLITKEILKDDFKIRLLNSIWWDYVTDWVNKMPNKTYKGNISQITSDLLNIGIESTYIDSINLLRLVKNFHSLVNLSEITSLNDEQKKHIEQTRDSLLKTKAFKPAAQDLADSDIIQLSVTGYKETEQRIIPVISFTTDSPTITENRIKLLKFIFSIYYSKTIKLTDKILIENFNEGHVICLSEYNNFEPFKFKETVSSKTINESRLSPL